MYAFMKFHRGLFSMPWYWQLWVALLVLMNIIAPLFFLPQLVAHIVLATGIASLMLMTLLTAHFGFTRIVGLGHILWIPLVGWLMLQLSTVPSHEAMGVWIRALIVVNNVSLAIDAADVVRYLTGERAETAAAGL